jgi:hypothetical protein
MGSSQVSHHVSGWRISQETAALHEFSASATSPCFIQEDRKFRGDLTQADLEKEFSFMDASATR